MGEHIRFVEETKGAEAFPTTGRAGLRTQMPGIATTVSNAARATGGIAPGNLIETATERKRYKIKSE